MAGGIKPPTKSFITEYFSLFILALFIVILRFVARLHTNGWRKLSWDDLTMLIAAILLCFFFSFTTIFARTSKIDPTINPTHIPPMVNPGLSNHGLSDARRASLDPASVEYQLRVIGSKLHLTGWSLYTSILWCLKISVALFYNRLTRGLTQMKKRIYIAYLLLAITYVAAMGTLLGACQPFNHYWQVNPNPGNNCLPAVSKVACYVIAVLNVITDIYLLHIPLLMLWAARISVVEKILLFLLFGSSIFVTVAGILRAYFIQSGGDSGGTAHAIWDIREIFVAFIVVNDPIIYSSLMVVRQSFKRSKIYASLRTRAQPSPAARWLFSSSTYSRGSESNSQPHGRSAVPSTRPESKTPLCTTTTTAAGRLAATLPWGHTRSNGQLGTHVRRADPPPAMENPEFGIHVTQGVKVDVHSMRNRASEPEPWVTGAAHSRTDSETQPGSFLFNDLAPGKSSPASASHPA